MIRIAARRVHTASRFALEGSERLVAELKLRYAGEPEFLQAAEEVIDSLDPLFKVSTATQNEEYLRALRLLVEPERVIMFRVPWEDRNGEIRVNRGYRVQFNSALGPYKGGLRFHPTVNLSVLKFLGFEQIFKNALTGLPMGGGKGGSDFDPKGKTDAEVRRFCQSFMMELSHHIGHRQDVPAGDIGVGGREIGYMYGMFTKLKMQYEGTLTGKTRGHGGILGRPEATGYGVIYMTHAAAGSLEGKRCIVSGAGNVSGFLAQKLVTESRATVLTLSDSKGVLIKPKGFSEEDVRAVQHFKDTNRASLAHLTLAGTEYVPGSVWDLVGQHDALQQLDCAFPCATQNEVDDAQAKLLVNAGVHIYAEGANMPTTAAGVDVLRGIRHYLPAKAANAGGVAVSGLEMHQNRGMVPWTFDETDRKLRSIMQNIYDEVGKAAAMVGRPGDTVVGANIAGFVKVATAMREAGYV